jgi:hypothetical protein
MAVPITLGAGTKYVLLTSLRTHRPRDLTFECLSYAPSEHWLTYPSQLSQGMLEMLRAGDPFNLAM